jgi:hypothetical protein
MANVHKYSLRLEQMENRTAPAGNLTITDAFLVDGFDNPLTAPVNGEEVILRATWTAQGLDVGDSYRITCTVDGVARASDPFFGGGSSVSESYAVSVRGWFASPGSHLATMTIDGADSVSETNETDNTLSFNFAPIAATDFPSKLITPIGGVPFRTWGITNYVDVNARSGEFNDYTGGPYSYDNHDGWDLALANFGSMDTGVPVYAAASGVVRLVEDGSYDRNVESVPFTPVNRIIIDLSNGWQTAYYHLRANSILVHTGDIVDAGQVLGLVGSSGSSTDAHLHFALYHNGNLVEPHFDPAAYWADPLPYQGTHGSSLLDSGLTRSAELMAKDLAAKERPASATVFTLGQLMTVWMRTFEIENDLIAVKLYQPDGQVIATSEISTVTDSYGRRALTFPLSAGLALGKWRIGIEINGVEQARHTFQITAAGAGAARVSQDDVSIPNGRTTPVNIGGVFPDDVPSERTFAITNIGTAPLTLSHLTLPSGFTLVGAFPSSIPVDGAATFTIQMPSAVPGTKAGILSFATSDPNAPTYAFNIEGIVWGGPIGAVHGQIFSDDDRNFIENGAELGLKGWTVRLLNRADNAPVAVTTTGFNGYYAFHNLPDGDYRVRMTPPPGWYQTSFDPRNVIVASNDALVSPLGGARELATSTILVANPLATTGGTLVLFTATVTPAPALGAVSFLDGFVPIPGGVDIPVVAGEARFSTASFGIGSHAVTAQYGGAVGFAVSVSNVQNVSIAVAPPAPSVVGIKINGGVPGFTDTQRSRVVNVTVTFNQAVQLDAFAMTLSLHTGNVAYGGVAQPAGFGVIPQLILTPALDKKTWTMTFSGAVETGIADGLGSLKDGVYDLLIDGAKVHPFGMSTVRMASNTTATLHRLFGDTNPPETSSGGFLAAVDNQDKQALSNAFNRLGAEYKPYLDFDGNGAIGSADNFEFRGRFSRSLRWRV